MSPIARWMLLALLLGTTACDVLVRPGQTIVLGNRGSVFGVNAPDAVNVVQGTLVVEDADLFGLGREVNATPTSFPRPGAGVRVLGGVVRVQKGLVAGGNLLVRRNDNPPFLQVDPRTVLLAPGIMSIASSVEIDGGTIRSSGIFGLTFGAPVGFPRPAVQAPAIQAWLSDLQIRGGELLLGETPGLMPDSGLRPIPALFAQESTLDISGGRMAGRVELLSSRARITGGVFEGTLILGSDGQNIGFFGDPPSRGPGCTELRGGTLARIFLATPGEQLFIFGSGFNLPLGRVPIPPPTRITPAIVFPTPILLTGVLEDGTPLDVAIQAVPDAAPEPEIVLAAPGDVGCAP